ncbi:unnamed protein product [Dicrocoelium dendriticum]|nr:unnamed protein product [Dicrocoelium dendriticum]
MDDPSVDKPIKKIIEDIVWCSGEPFSVNPSVVNLLFSHLRSWASHLARQLYNDQFKLSNLLNAIREDPLKLAHVADYLRITGGGPEVRVSKLGLDLNEVVEASSDDDVLLNHIAGLCAKLDIHLPDYVNKSFSKILLPFIRGRRLRLSRIDNKFACASVACYLAFTRLRQSATFLILTQPFRGEILWRWIFCPCDKSLPIAEQRGECLRVLAHLLTSEILDVIDLVLFYRPKLNIGLQTPLTPVEVERAIGLLSSKRSKRS